MSCDFSIDTPWWKLARVRCSLTLMRRDGTVRLGFDPVTVIPAAEQALAS